MTIPSSGPGDIKDSINWMSKVNVDARKKFSELSPKEKAAVVGLTAIAAIATLGIGAAPAFKKLTETFSASENYSSKEAKKTIELTTREPKLIHAPAPPQTQSSQREPLLPPRPVKIPERPRTLPKLDTVPPRQSPLKVGETLKGEQILSVNMFYVKNVEEIHEGEVCCLQLDDRTFQAVRIEKIERSPLSIEYSDAQGNMRTTPYLYHFWKLLDQPPAPSAAVARPKPAKPAATAPASRPAPSKPAAATSAPVASGTARKTASQGPTLVQLRAAVTDLNSKLPVFGSKLPKVYRFSVQLHQAELLIKQFQEKGGQVPAELTASLTNAWQLLDAHTSYKIDAQVIACLGYKTALNEALSAKLIPSLNAYFARCYLMLENDPNPARAKVLQSVWEGLKSKPEELARAMADPLFLEILAGLRERYPALALN